jgi:monoamine oxidase
MKRRAFIKKSLRSIPAIALSSGLMQSCDGSENVKPNGKSVIVVGAGIAGLAAGKKLRDKGFTVTVLEAQATVGGRIKTNRTLNFPFDEGASWIHGASNNPLTPIADIAAAKTFFTDENNVKVFDVNGLAHNDTILDGEYQAFQTVLNTIRNKGNANESFETIFKAQYPQYVNNRIWKYMLSSDLEFDIGGDISEISSIDFDDDDVFAGNDLYITNGFDRIVNYLAQTLFVKPNEPVSSINYSGDKVKVTTKVADYEADYIIVTVPLGVLKNNTIAFTPALSNEKTQAITRVKMGVVNKFLIGWDLAFWDSKEQYLGYTPETKGKFNYFLNTRKIDINSKALITFAYGNYAKLTETMSDQAVIDEIMVHMKAIYGNNTPNPTTFLRTKWGSNPYSYGSYSFASNLSRSSDFDILAKEVNNKIFFAGEHTSKQYRGTAHGAYLSGEKAADKIIAL